jgi:ABC-type multidrug transport system fused ATPase/permease subunit
MIQSALETLTQGKTVIAIAHRLSTILSSDLIVVMENGRLVGQGPHHELLATSPVYRHLYELQFHAHETGS